MPPPLTHVAFRRGEPAAGGLRRATQETVAVASARQDSLRHRELVHLLRVSVKRLRAFLALLRPALGREAYRREDRFLRDIARSLATTRDRQVAVRTVGRLQKLASGKRAKRALAKAEAALGRVAANAPGDRAAGAETEAGPDPVGSAVTRLHDAFARIQALEAGNGGWEVLAPGFRDTYRRARRRFATWLDSGAARDAHDCRKHVKYLMFQLELVEPANRRRISRCRARLSKLETKLGQIQDCRVLAGMVARLAEDGGLTRREAGVVTALCGKRSRSLSVRCVRLGRKVFARRPRKFLDRLDRDWRRWRAG
jgi:CHAD domain-containing protein